MIHLIYVLIIGLFTVLGVEIGKEIRDDEIKKDNDYWEKLESVLLKK